MNYCCNDDQRILVNNCSCCINSKAVILSAVIALLLLSCLDEECAQTVSQFLQSTGELMGTGLTRGCCCR